MMDGMLNEENGLGFDGQLIKPVKLTLPTRMKTSPELSKQLIMILNTAFRNRRIII